MKNIIGFIIAVIFLLSCNSGVDKKQAEKLIKEAFVLPRAETRLFYSGEYDFVGAWDANNWLPGEAWLESNGYRTVELVNQYQVQNGWVMQHRSIVNIQFTEKAQQYLQPTSTYNTLKEIPVKVAELDFGEIVELRKINDSQYDVVFNLKRSITPMYEAVRLGRRHFYRTHYMLRDKDIKSIKLPIIKNEDGWHIDREELLKADKAFDPERDDQKERRLMPFRNSDRAKRSARYTIN